MKSMQNMYSNSFDLAIVDPPYGIGESIKNSKSRNTPIKQKNNKLLKAPDNVYTYAEWDLQQPAQSYFDELFRVAKKIILWGSNYFSFTQKKFSSGRIIWDKVNYNNDFSDCEIAWTNVINSVRQIEYMWNGMMQGKSILEGRTQQGNKILNEKRIHPTQKPIKLYEWLLINYAKEGDKILDTHGGSMSIAIACFNLNFDLTLCEIDKDYYKAGIERFEQHKKQIKLF